MFLLSMQTGDKSEGVVVVVAVGESAYEKRNMH